METKRVEVPFTVKAITEDDRFFHIKGFANTWDIDLGGDRAVKGCFADSIIRKKESAADVFESDFKALMPSLWQHDSKNPIGVHVELMETEEGLFSHSIFPKEDTFVSGKLIPQIKVGSVRKQSIGYIPQKVSFEMVDDKEVRNLEIVELKEASPVTFPMNEGADITGFKSDQHIVHKDEAEKLTERDFEELLTKGSKFTKNASKTIISLIKTGWDAQDLEQRDAEEAKRIGEKMDKLKKLMRNE